MSTQWIEDLEMNYNAGRDETAADYPTLEDKLEQGIAVTRTALESYQNPIVLWTGGKDSTLVVYLLLEVTRQFDYDMPPAVFIDHFQHFEDVTTFVERWAERWDLELLYAQNESLGNLADEPGDEIAVEDLSEANQREVREKLEYTEDSFPFLLDTYVGNHLLKTVPLNETIEEYDVDAVISGVRWDEQEARASETFFSPRHDHEKYPPHDRVHPILQFDEEAVWAATWKYIVPDAVDEFPEDGYIPEGVDDLPAGIDPTDIPISPKYWEGFRSLGSEVGTTKSADEPAWLQDLAATTEREGRAQDKEDLMGRLRDLGYM